MIVVDSNIIILTYDDYNHDCDYNSYLFGVILGFQ